MDDVERQSFDWRQLKNVILLPPSGQTIHKAHGTIKTITIYALRSECKNVKTDLKLAKFGIA